jgi:exodeoxyribonuclease-3
LQAKVAVGATLGALAATVCFTRSVTARPLTSTLQRARAPLWVFCASDYHLATPGIAALARREAIYLAQRFSDHAPLIIDYDLDL